LDFDVERNENAMGESTGNTSSKCSQSRQQLLWFSAFSDRRAHTIRTDDHWVCLSDDRRY